MKQQQLLEIIKEELRNHAAQRHYDQVVPIIDTNVVLNVIGNDLPIFEDHLREIIFDQSKDKISQIIRELDYQKKLREAQDEMEKQIFENKKKRKKKKKKLVIPPSQNIENPPPPENVTASLATNFAHLLQNFTQLIANQVTAQITQTGNRKIRIRKKRPSTPNFEQSLQESSLDNEPPPQYEPSRSSLVKPVDPKSHYVDQKPKAKPGLIESSQTIKKSDQPKLPQQQSSSLGDRPPEPAKQQQQNFYQPTGYQPSQPKLKESQQYGQQQSQVSQQSTITRQQNKSHIPGQSGYSAAQSDISKKQEASQNQGGTSQYEEQFESESNLYSETDQVPDLQPRQAAKKQNDFQTSEEYSDDFIEESNDKFNQNQSNFFNPYSGRQTTPKNYPSPPKQIDFADDIEDLLL